MNSPNDLKIGLVFSGGGFRAAAFSLGVLTYLDSIEFNGSTLLEHVKVLSTTSGGTITGARYAIGIKKDESLDEIYKCLYKFMTEVDLIDLGLDRLLSNRGWDRKRIKSVINAFSDIYDTELFDRAKFGTLLSDENPIHLEHLSFNSTEFDNALQFRFQRTPGRGIIGNHRLRIPREVAENIRMSDILAASSCFPGGFEPINFPSDFILPDSDKLSEIINGDRYPVGLMDGGVVDNQGIEPLLLAEERMKKKAKKDPSIDKESNVLDLLIISDVSSPYMEEYNASTQMKLNWWRNLTPQKIMLINSAILVFAVVALIKSIHNWQIGLFSSIITLNVLAFTPQLIIHLFAKKFPGAKMYISSLRKLSNLRLIVYENMISNRINSVLKMMSSVSLKAIRKLHYYQIWEDDSWKNRRIMSAIYELRHGEDKLERKLKKDLIDKKLKPSKKIQDTAHKAASMGTTLWFTKDQIENEDMLNSIIACGQFNLCWDLLEYIGKLNKNNDNTNNNHMLLMKCQTQLMSDWKKFQTDPLWFVDSINKRNEI